MSHNQDFSAVDLESARSHELNRKLKPASEQYNESRDNQFNRITLRNTQTPNKEEFFDMKTSGSPEICNDLSHPTSSVSSVTPLRTSSPVNNPSASHKYRVQDKARAEMTPHLSLNEFQNITTLTKNNVERQLDDVASPTSTASSSKYELPRTVADRDPSSSFLAPTAMCSQSNRTRTLRSKKKLIIGKSMLNEQAQNTDLSRKMSSNEIDRHPIDNKGLKHVRHIATTSKQSNCFALTADEQHLHVDSSSLESLQSACLTSSAGPFSSSFSNQESKEDGLSTWTSSEKKRQALLSQLKQHEERLGIAWKETVGYSSDMGTEMELEMGINLDSNRAHYTSSSHDSHVDWWEAELEKGLDF